MSYNPIRAKEYREKNKERINKQRKESYERNKEKYRLNYQENKEQHKLKRKENYSKYREKTKIYNSQYYKNNKEELSEKRKQYYIENKERLDEYNKKWNEKTNWRKQWWLDNKERIVQQRKERMKNDPDFKLRVLLRGRINKAIKEAKTTKQTKTTELIGCSFEEARKHLESQFVEGMSWDNYGFYGWHIDHIIPCNTFDLTDPEQQKLCFHYTNLRPLWSKINWSRPKDGSDVNSSNNL